MGFSLHTNIKKNLKKTQFKDVTLSENYVIQIKSHSGISAKNAKQRRKELLGYISLKKKK